MKVMVVTLIHGTWAGGAAWTNTKSAIREAIAKQYTDVHFEQFEWSGSNLHRARCRAAVGLREHLKKVTQLYPGQDQFLIGHSHGGTVALYALRDQCVAKSVRGVVCLSTPFIHCRPRSLGAAGLAPSLVFMMICSGFFLHSAAGRLWPSFGTFSFQVQALVLVFPMTGAIFGLIGLSDLFLRRVIGVTSLKEASKRIRDSFAFPSLSPDALFVVRAPGDEASGALASSHFFSFLLTKLSRWLNLLAEFGAWVSSLTEYLSVSGRVFRCAGFLALAVLLTWLAFLGDSGYVRGTLICLALVSLVVAIAFIVPDGCLLVPLQFESLGFFIVGAAGACLIPLLVLLTIVSSPFGVDAALLAPVFELTAEGTPPGRVTIYELSGINVRGLWHSAAYSSEEVFKEMLMWMAAQKGPKSEPEG